MKQDLKTIEDCRNWVKEHIPFAVKPVKKAKTMFIYPFKSSNAEEVIINHLAQKLFELLNEAD